ncbi:MtrAB system histidine kinase MtrB [Georgenia alba]|uniref:Sensor histidine kinase MtrB n=1 Tax=Georgenia alba TaxID=2233858 RepID=A0ABW2QA38_9MICO
MTDLPGDVGGSPPAGPRAGAVAHPAGPATTYRPRSRTGLRRRVRRKMLMLLRRWRSSLTVRVVASTVLGGLIALGVIGGVLSSQIRSGLYDERVTQMLEDAALQSENARATFEGATASTAQQAQEIANSWLYGLPTTGSDAVGATLRRSPDAVGVPIIEPGTDVGLRELITPDLRRAVAGEGGQHWQPVALPTQTGGNAPGIVVGSPVTLPVAGDYELYLFYSLEPEEETISLVLRVLAVGAVAIVVLLGVMTWGITRWVLQPVTDAVLAAERLAEGQLDERMDVRGRDELALLGQSFNEMAASLQRQIERMEELSRVQQRFVSDVSHELRTPLTTIRMAGEMIHDARDSFDPTVRRSAELLHAQLDRFESMLGDLLEISRFDAGAAVLEVEERDLRDLVQRVIDMTEILAEAKGSPIRVDAPEEPCTADVDPRRVERVVRNLLTNAIEHGDGRPIDITVAVNATAVAVRVRDHGVGMDAETARHVFDRFWRADPARARTTGGTGLGLAIALEDTRLHGGTLEAWGRRDVGAAFLLTLPRRAGAAVVTPPLDLQDPRQEGTATAPLGPAEEGASRQDPASVTRMAEEAG